MLSTVTVLVKLDQLTLNFMLSSAAVMSPVCPGRALTFTLSNYTLLHFLNCVLTRKSIDLLKSKTPQNCISIFFFFFYFLGYTKYRESIAFAQKIDFQILMNVHVLRATESKKVIFGMSSVCVSVCLSVCLPVCLSVCVSVCGHHNSKNN